MAICVVKRPCEPPAVVDMELSLESLQAVVGGYVGTVPGGRGIDLWVNEHGPLEDLPFNVSLGGRVIVGPIVATAATEEGDAASLSLVQIMTVMRVLAAPSSTVEA